MGVSVVVAWWARPTRLPSAVAHTKLWGDDAERAGQIRDDEARTAFVAAHRLLRWAVTATFPGVPQVRIERTATGRPVIAERPGASVSLSHGHDLVAVAIGVGPQVGIDVEDRPVPEWRDAAEAVFHPSELAQLLDMPCEQQEVAFRRLWMAKEAWAKAAGIGIGRPQALPPLSFRSGNWQPVDRSWRLLSAPLQIPTTLAVLDKCEVIVWHRPEL